MEVLKNGVGIFAAVAVFLLGGASLPECRADETVKICDFEKNRIGSLPKEWRAGVTNADSLPVWQVLKRSDAPSGTHVLAMKKPAVKGGLFGIGSVFNLCYCPNVSLKNLKATVSFRAVSGSEDRGGGIMWRVADDNNYYVARFNPLEDNFRIYYVKDGKRVMISSAAVKLKKNRWHTMTVIQNGKRFEGYLDGKKFLSGIDGHIKAAGAVGLWTKADAVTLFDDFSLYRIKDEQ